jgi:hypothetical protein
MYEAKNSSDICVSVFLFVVAIVLMVCCSLFLVATFYSLITARACIKKESFHIDTEELARISEDEIVRPSFSVDYIMNNMLGVLLYEEYLLL